MKRALCIIATLAAVAVMADARDYTYLQPPSIAVVDFEVSMSAASREASKTFYGELVSQALLSMLVQQNAAAVVKVAAADSSLLAAKSVVAANTGGEEVRHYFPPLFKIYDKRYVEMALQNANFTTKDLYTKNVSAFNFTDLDYLILGNVYETKRTVANASKDAIGFNVRVLNTKRSEELYSYTAVVDKDLSDLPAACAMVCRTLMRDILNSTCAQFIISDTSGLTTPYRLFWQSRQVVKDDTTVADSDDSYKREVHTDQFYWVLPGQYIISVYNADTQRIRTIPFTISAGDIKHVAIEKQHLEAERGTITISGILPTDSYIFSAKEQKRREQYWWEVGGITPETQSFSVTFSNGENPEVKMDSGTAAPADKDAVKAEYRAATNDIVIRNVMLSSYDITATSQPPSSSYDITGWWKVSTRQISQSSTPLSVDLRSQGDAHIQIADFGLQQKAVIDTPHKTEVTFFLNPGFGYDTTLYIDDGSGTGADWLWWRNKEKVTIQSEYSQAEWDSLPYVTFTFEPNGTFGGISHFTFQKQFEKTELDPARDTVVLINMEDEAANWKAQQASAASLSKTQPATTTISTTTGSATTPKAAGAEAATPSTMFLTMAAGLGEGSISYYQKSGSYTYKYTASGMDVGANLALTWSLAPGFGLGFGGAVHEAMDYYSTTAAVVTANVMLGDLAKQSVAFTLEAGIGVGFLVDGGLIFMNDKKNGGFLVNLGYINYDASGYDITVGSTDYTAAANGFYIGAGYLLGL